MAANNTVKVAIVGDASSLEAAARKSNQALGGLEGQAKRTGAGGLSSFKDLAAGAGLAFGTEQILSYGQELYNTGQRLEVLRAKSKVVFEDQIGDVKKWADENAAAMGLTTTELMGTAAAAADLLKPMGFTAAEAANMSKEMVGLSGALAAWSGGTRDAAEVSTILQKSLLGERDGLKELGISIMEADVQTRLHANGQDKLKGQALEQAKAQATLQLILEKSTDAQKAWNDGSMDSVKAANEAKAGFAELKDSIATGLMPVFKEATNQIQRDLIPALEGLSEGASFVGEKLETDAGKKVSEFGKLLMGDPVVGIRKITEQWKHIDDIWKGRTMNSLAVMTGVWANELGYAAGETGDLADETKGLNSAVGRTEDQLKETERNAKEYADQLNELRKRNEEVLKATEDLIGAHEVDLPKALDDVTSSLLDFYETTEESKKAQQGLSESSAEYQLEAIKQRDAGRDLTQSMMDYANEVLAAAEAQAALSGKQLTAEEKATILAGAMTDLGNKFPPLADKANELAAKFGGIAGAAEDTANRVVAAMQGMRDRLVEIFNSIDIGNGLSMITATADQLERQASRIGSTRDTLNALSAAAQVHGPAAVNRAINGGRA